MNQFEYRQGELFAEDVSARSLAEQYGTPLFVYSRAAIEATWQQIADALSGREHMICYAVKANSNLAVLNLMARLGSGFDIVSGGELERVLAAGAKGDSIVFSGVGKTRAEIERALEVGIYCFNVESEQELQAIAEIAAAQGRIAPVSLRINPNVDARTHPYISTGLKENKFGIQMERALDVYRLAAASASLDVKGIDCHIGSQLTESEPYNEAVRCLLDIVDTLQSEGLELSHLDVGGGQGIRYRDEQTLDIEQWALDLNRLLGNRPLRLLVEPGRFIVGNAGILLTRVEYLKHSPEKNFCIVDCAMNDLIRPALYSAWQAIEPVQSRGGDSLSYDVVGPVCESADFLGKDRALVVEQGDYLAIKSAGAYSFVMSSNYNSRPRAAEVMVDGSDSHLVRAREQVADLFANEMLLP